MDFSREQTMYVLCAVDDEDHKDMLCCAMNQHTVKKFNDIIPNWFNKLNRIYYNEYYKKYLEGKGWDWDNKNYMKMKDAMYENGFNFEIQKLTDFMSTYTNLKYDEIYNYVTGDWNFKIYEVPFK